MRLIVVPAMVAALACTLAACSGGSPEPSPVAEPERSPSASALPAATPTSAPTSKSTANPSPTGAVVQTNGTAIDAETKAAATAFVREVLSAIDKGANTGDFSDAQGLFDSSCDTCRKGIAYAQGIYAKNQKIIGGQYENPRFSVGKSPVADVVVRVDSTVAAYKVVDSSGKTIGSAPAETDISNYHLKKSGSSWHVVRWSYS